MAQFKSALKILVGLGILALVGLFVVTNYSWVFSKRIRGEILNVERVTEQTAILGNRTTEAQLHTYSILIQGEDGRMYTSSSEDSQWQVAKKGYCVEALLYRYPPWRLSLANTFFNARLSELYNCKTKAPASPGATPADEAPSESSTPAQ